ncbi:MAG TPA: hypothetical protein VFJ43_03455 [Bacteroidia bacterium]|nr:hypothetical protein [Bacteroidia bacterium]
MNKKQNSNIPKTGSKSAFVICNLKNGSCGILIFFLLMICSCKKDFIETDLSGKLVSIIAPADQDTVATARPLFWWNEIEGTRNYHLQIVYPDFSSPQVLLYDTLIDADRFYPVLNPGYTYYWRIRPENGSSHGDWMTRSLTIDSTVSLGAQQVIITSPSSNGYSTSASVIAFTWNIIPAATFYRIDITNVTSGSNVTSTTTSVNTFSYTFPEGNYSFSVRAENATSFTPWSVRTFSVDQTAPAAPQLVLPANGTFYSSPPATVNFDWTSAPDALTDSLYISTDSTFASGIQAALLLNSSQSNYAWTSAQAATVYFWRLRSSDAAGNRSNYSATFKFTDN